MKTIIQRTRISLGKTLAIGLIGAVLLSCFLIAFTNQASAAENKYILKMASSYPSMHPSIANGFNGWMEELKQKSGGRLTIQFYAPGTLTPYDEHYEAVKSGIADLTFEVTRENFPLSDVVAMPFIFKSTEAASATLQALFDLYPEIVAEYKGVRLLWGHTSAQYQLHMQKNKKVTSLEEIKGKKIIVWTPNGRKYLASLGAAPQEMLATDTYMGLSRGMADGTFCPIAPMRAFKLDEVTKYHILFSLSQDAFYGAINPKSFDNLPADLQKLLLDMSGMRLARLFGKTLDDGSKAGMDYMVSKGHEVVDIPESELNKMVATQQPVYEEWIKENEERGHKNAREIFEKAKALGKQFQAEIDAR